MTEYEVICPGCGCYVPYDYLLIKSGSKDADEEINDLIQDNLTGTSSKRTLHIYCEKCNEETQ